ncbi:LOW QUALITY PROTEIN: olfactory receptor 1052-like [Cebus imitator]|uniref:LOW QUALITY PROTEIN: olfactory receptor 1052-like n=1 Tax=Cebus imitator TaxID=2715852 RepID=UPI00080A5EB1|nr:LOW QUALITY PROTEIN: olfactory receptor 1052-like [Cebus imitator]
MAEENITVVTGFILLGLTSHAELKVALFVLFLVIYAITLVGNLGIIFLIQITPKLHTPMYFFLSWLSFVDTCYSSVIAPRTLINFLVVRKTISFSACIGQHLFFGLFITTEGFLLLVMMAYDRYVAIVSPLLYTVAMSKRKCVVLVTGSFIGGMINSLTHTVGLERLYFCGSKVDHFFCDVPPLLKLSCSDTSMNELLLLTFSGVIAMVTFLIVIISYIFIAFAILRIRSASGKQKAFSTCASHLTAVTIFYGTLSFSYIQPSSQYSVEQEKVVSVFYTLVIPVLNPLIYSLRNKDVKEAVKRAIEMKHFLC